MENVSWCDTTTIMEHSTITITDNDAEPMISIATVAAQMEDDGALPPNTPADTLYNIDVTLNDGTAAMASDKTVSVGFTDNARYCGFKPRL